MTGSASGGGISNNSGYSSKPSLAIGPDGITHFAGAMGHLDGNVVTRDEFLLEVWKYPSANVQTRTVDNTLAALRRKIDDDPAQPRFIHTVRGVGFRFVTEDELDGP